MLVLTLKENEAIAIGDNNQVMPVRVLAGSFGGRGSHRLAVPTGIWSAGKPSAIPQP